MAPAGKKSIPKGYYCYTHDGTGELITCPYWSMNQYKETHNNGYCSYLGIGDWQRPDNFVGLLWDQCKECGINMEDGEEDEDEL